MQIAHTLFQYEIFDMKRRQLLFASDAVKQMVLEKIAKTAVVDVEVLAQQTMDWPTIAQNISTLIIQHVAYRHLRVSNIRTRPMNRVQGSSSLELTFAACAGHIRSHI